MVLVTPQFLNTPRPLQHSWSLAFGRSTQVYALIIIIIIIQHLYSAIVSYAGCRGACAWLLVEFHIKNKMHMMHSGQFPSYPADTVLPPAVSSSCTGFCLGSIQWFIQPCICTEFGMHGYSSAGPRILKSLPANLHNITDISWLICSPKFHFLNSPVAYLLIGQFYYAIEH